MPEWTTTVCRNLVHLREACLRVGIEPIKVIYRPCSREFRGHFSLLGIHFEPDYEPPADLGLPPWGGWEDA